MQRAESPSVLLVDDDDALRGTAVDILRLHGFAPHGAPNGRAALALQANLRPAPIVAVVDLRLPDMNGLDLTRELRHADHELQVVILTGNATVETAIRALRDEACDYLLKPVEPTHLVRTLRLAEGRWRLRRTEHQLEMTQQVLRATFDASPLPIITYDREHRVTLWNPAAARLFGWTAAEAMQQVPPIVLTEDIDRDRALRAASLRGEMFVGIEAARRTRSGQRVDVRLTQAPLTDAEGRVTGLLALYEDITERRRIEEHLRESQRLDAVGRLAGGMAHDFNNLLAVILAEAELALGASDLVQPARETLTSIRHAASSGATLTRQLLTFARRQKTELTMFNANGLLAEADRIVRRLLGERIELRTEMASELGTVHADRQQLEQVITNLTANARDAMPDGGTFTLRTFNRDFGSGQAPPGMQAGRWVVIEATDTGAGMPEDVRRRLFEPFFTTKDRDKGTGLGLATSYGIINGFGGFIAVESRLGRGSTFSVFLPRAEGVATEPAAVVSDRPLTGTETVLVVEDQEQLRSIARRVLANRGYTVHSVGTGRAAVEVVVRLTPPPDLVILDVNLPDESGIEIARRMRTVLPELKVLLTSGAAGNLGPNAEGFAFLPKPFGAAELARAVREAIDRPAE